MWRVDSLERHWCWEGLGAGGEGEDRGWDGWMSSPTWWTWVWVNSRSWWWTGRPGVLQFMGSQGVRYDWVTELNWTDVLCQHSEVVLWNLLSVQMFFWWICWGESGRPILFLHHLRTASDFVFLKRKKICLIRPLLKIGWIYLDLLMSASFASW